MSETACASPAGTRLPPRLSRLRSLRLVLARGRVDMLTPLRRMHAECGSAAMVDLSPVMQSIYLFGPDANALVLADREGRFSAQKPWTWIMGRIFRGGLLLRDGEDHRHHRRIMHAAFTRRVLHEYAAFMGPLIETGVAGWDRPDLRAFGAFKALTLDMAAALFVGADLGPASDRMNRAFEDMVAASMSLVRLPLPGLEFNRGLKGRASLEDYFRQLLPERRSKPGTDMLSRLCHAEDESGHRFDDQEIVDHMIFLMMAAHDTTTSTLTSMTYELAAHPDWQERIREESLALDRPHLAFEDLDELPGLSVVLKETLRRYPPLPVIPRVALRSFEFEGYTVPEGAMVVVSPIFSHHMPEWWRAPQLFDPERFSPARQEDAQHTHLWIPFGGGAHHCLGFKFAELQVKSIVHQLVRRYRWSVPTGYRMPVQQAPISKPRDGLPVTFERIH